MSQDCSSAEEIYKQNPFQFKSINEYLLLTYFISNELLRVCEENNLCMYLVTGEHYQGQHKQM